MFESIISLTQSSPYSVPTFIFSLSFSCVLYMLTEPKEKRKDRDINGVGSLLRNSDSILKDVDGSVRNYESLFSGSRKDVGVNSNPDKIEERQKEYETMVSSFYDLVTDFYEYGWGQSFHFAPRFKTETFMESIVRAEHFLALKLGIGEGSKVLDVGCGVGGPMRNIARFASSDIKGVTINTYQVACGNRHNASQGLVGKCESVQGDFQKLDEKFEKETFDAAYEIEATCHSPDRVTTFSQVAGCLKPGGLFAGYEWVMLPSYDPDNIDHVRVKEGIEVGNGLPTLVTGDKIKEALEEAGFEVLEAYDANRGVNEANEVPWYATLKGEYTISGFRMTPFGRFFTHCMVTTLEFLCIAPKGSVRVSALLNATAVDLVEGGEKELFTPSYFFLARKK
jgi:sterol 24-C-methyltransferase